MEKQNETIREAIAEIRLSISLGDISRRYFGKSAAWFYQRINGTMVNGKPASFNPKEQEQLKSALLDLSERIRESAENL